MNIIIRVANHSHAAAVAGAIAHSIRKSGQATVQAIGAHAVNQAVKAAAIACTYLEKEEIRLSIIPRFINVHSEGSERTAIRFNIKVVL